MGGWIVLQLCGGRFERCGDEEEASGWEVSMVAWLAYFDLSPIKGRRYAE
jgi:hypothetical protein